MVSNANSPTVITDAHSATSVEMSGRVRRYAITMAFRMVCFAGIFFVHGWARWALFGAAVFLPYVAVLFANQANVKDRGTKVVRGAPEDAKQLTVGPQDEVVTGEVVTDEEPSPWSTGDGSRGREDRVA